MNSDYVSYLSVEPVLDEDLLVRENNYGVLGLICRLRNYLSSENFHKKIAHGRNIKFTAG